MLLDPLPKDVDDWYKFFDTANLGRGLHLDLQLAVMPDGARGWRVHVTQTGRVERYERTIKMLSMAQLRLLRQAEVQLRPKITMQYPLRKFCMRGTTDDLLD